MENSDVPATVGAAELTGRSHGHVQAYGEIVLQPPAAAAWMALREAARHAGIDLAVASSFRDFDTQLRIWNGKWRGERPLLDRDGQLLSAADLSPPERIEAILLWSALPGASRHHWGTEVDVYDRAALPAGQPLQLVSAEYAPGGPFASLAVWLREHMAQYGFYRPYRRDRGGVQPEPWHLSHAPSARAMSRRLRPAMLADALATAPIEGREWLLGQIDGLYERYVRRVDRP